MEMGQLLQINKELEEKAKDAVENNTLADFFTNHYEDLREIGLQLQKNIHEFNEIIKDSDMIECSSCEILQSTVNFYLKPYMTAGGKFICSECFLGNVEKTL